MTRRLLSISLAVAVSLAAVGCAKRKRPARSLADAAQAAQTAQIPGAQTSDRPAAPPLEGGIAWLGTDRPLTLAELRGHVVILDFWTYCCINCMHVIPELKAVEHEFAGKPVVVIGVHSGKFDAEKDPARIRAAMARYDVAHPVVVDSLFAIWGAYGVRAWPTLAVIDPEGGLVAVSPGEPPPGILADLVGELLVEAERKGTLAQTPIEIEAPPAADTGPLAFPGKVAVARDGRIAIADSNHHRVVIVSARGELLDVAGSGIEGSADGGFEVAAFRRPQGVAWSADGNTIYVADTENHQIRAIHLTAGTAADGAGAPAARTVTTLAGNGQKGGYMRGSSTPREVALRSPWDVAVRGDDLYIAMAGAHQLWVYDLRTDQLGPLAGSGKESIEDGDFDAAAFSQPSGLALVGNTLYVADSEVSAIRAVDLGGDGEGGRVSTLVGVGLFDFGDVDGVGDAVRLQHALGVAHAGGALYVADTYNNKIKRIDPATRRAETIAGGDRAELFEPGGIATMPDGRLLIADTNNHRLRVLDPKTRALTTFALRGVTPPAARGLILDDSRTDGQGGAVREVTAAGVLGPGNNTIALELLPPAGAELSANAPLVVEGHASPGIAFPRRITRPITRKVAGRVGSAGGADSADSVSVELPVTLAANASGRAHIDVSYYWCSKGEARMCVPERARLAVALDIRADAPAGRATLSHRAAPYEPTTRNPAGRKD